MSILESNLRLVAKAAPALASAVREAGGGYLEIEPARSGPPTARAQGRLLHSAYDPLKEATTWSEAQRSSCRDEEVILILGLGLLYHVETLCQVLPPSMQIVVVVPDLTEFHDACAARPWGPWAARVTWVWGEPHAMAEQIVATGKPVRILTYEAAAQLHRDAHAAVEQALRRDAARRAGGQLRIAVIGPIYGGSLPVTRSVVAALQSLGHEVDWIDQSLHAQSYHSLAGLKDLRHRQVMQSKFADFLSQLTLVRVAERPPDLVLAMAQAPMTLPVLEHLRNKHFLTAMWFVENYRHLTYWQQMAGGFDFWFVIQQAACLEAFRRAGAKQVSYLPMAADPEVHTPLVPTPAEQSEYGADVSFVGAGYANRRAILPQLITKEWTFKLWGNEWDGASALSSVLQRNGARIDTETCVKVFNATKVNVNLHSHTGRGLDPDADFVNPRTFELAACGAYQLVDQRSLLGDLFTQEEIAVFRRTEDLPDRIRTSLREPDLRKAMGQAARRRILEEHTFQHRMQELLAQVGMSSPDRVGTILRGERQAGQLGGRSADHPELLPLLHRFPDAQRVELEDVAEGIRRRGPTANLSREELLVLMLDEYRVQTRDLV
ncbi:MAG TPA: glycosyltransferase [Nitrospira sp.]|nr:glycosyltransferase [Nitrospira sp.]